MGVDGFFLFVQCSCFVFVWCVVGDLFFLFFFVLVKLFVCLACVVMFCVLWVFILLTVKLIT